MPIDRYLVKIDREVEQDDGSTKTVRETIFATVNKRRAEKRAENTPGAKLLRIPAVR